MKLMRNQASRLVLFTICLMYLIFYVDRVNLSTAAPIMQKDLGLTATQLGIAFSAFAYPYAFFQIAGGWLGDRLGPRVTLCICALLVAVSTIWTGLVGGLLGLFLARLCLGIGEGPAFPTATRALSNWMRPDQRAFAQGITHAFARFGNAVTPPLIAVLIVAFSWRVSFYVLGAASLLWAVLWWFYFRDDPRTHPQITPQDLEGLPSATVAATRKDVPWGPLLKRILPVTLTDFCYGWILWLYLNWLPSFFMHEFQLDLKKSALFAAGVFFAGVIGDTLGGLISDRILRKTGNVGKARNLGDRRRLSWVLLLHVADRIRSRSDDGRDLPQPRILLCGIDRRSDLGRPNGYCAAIFRQRQWLHEFRIWHGRHHLARRVRLGDRSDRTMGRAVHRIARGPSDRCGSGLHHQSWKTFCRCEGKRSASP